MPEIVSTPGHQLAVQALFDSGQNGTQIAQALGLSVGTVYRLRNQSLLDPDLIRHASKTVSDKLTLVASMAADEALQQSVTGQWAQMPAKDLVLMASKALEASGTYAALGGTNDPLAAIASAYAVEPAHAVSRITVTKQVTVESSAPQPVVIEHPSQT